MFHRNNWKKKKNKTKIESISTNALKSIDTICDFIEVGFFVSSFRSTEMQLNSETWSWIKVKIVCEMWPLSIGIVMQLVAAVFRIFI